MSLRKRNYNKGFTLVELLVTITIFVILTGVVLFNQSKFNSSILLTNLAYDTALTVRQAQTYGINIKEFNVNGTGNFFVPYGVHFDISAPKSFILFADLDKKGYYDFSTSTCDAPSGCVNRYNISRGNYISDLCTSDMICGFKKMDIVFIRPNPDAHISVSADGSTATRVPDQVSAIIKLKGSDGSVRKVSVRNNGLIEIVH